jgi:nucleoside-diphosphate kinase
MERTLILVKPDGVKRGLVGEVIKRFENRGLIIKHLKLTHPQKELVEVHYAEHREKPFYGSLVDYLTSGNVVAMVLEGENAIKATRMTMGTTNASEATPGTIRGDYALNIEQNIVHGSADAESAKREIAIWFPESN